MQQHVQHQDDARWPCMLKPAAFLTTRALSMWCWCACRLAHTHNWTAQGVVIGDRDAVPYDYSQLLARSVFCAAATGDGWATRIEDAIQHGCIPVIFHDGVHGPFESILEYDAFSLRLKESAVDEHLPKVGGPQQAHAMSWARDRPHRSHACYS